MFLTENILKTIIGPEAYEAMLELENSAINASSVLQNLDKNVGSVGVGNGIKDWIVSGNLSSM